MAVTAVDAAAVVVVDVAAVRGVTLEQLNAQEENQRDTYVCRRMYAAEASKYGSRKGSSKLQ